MNNDFVKLSNSIKAVNNLSLLIQKTKIEFTDLMDLGELNPEISNNLNWLKAYFGCNEKVIPELTPEDVASKNKPDEKVIPQELTPEDVETKVNLKPVIPIPDDEVIKVPFIKGIYASSKGTIYDENMNVIPQRWIDGDMRVDIGTIVQRRVFTIIAPTFGTHAPASEGWILTHKSRDGRDNRKENIFWVPKSLSRCNEANLSEDIARRLVDCDGNIDKVLEYYEGSIPVVTKDRIKDVKNKLVDTLVCDSIFTVGSNGKLYPTPEVIEDNSLKSEGFDVFTFLLNSKDINQSLELIRDKIQNKQKLSYYEREILVLASVDNFDEKDSDLSRKIDKEFGYKMSPGYINRILDAMNPEICKILFGGVIK